VLRAVSTRWACSAATEFEGNGPTGTLSNTTAALRNANGATDTDDNAADFTAGTPNPRNSGGGDPDPDPDPVAVCDVEESDLTPIYEVQGAGASTPLAGQSVVVRGVVTADFTSGGDTGIPANQGLRGFFIEAIAADRDDRRGFSRSGRSSSATLMPTAAKTRFGPSRTPATSIS
jgi:predicted extracellular nuclease